MRSILRGKQIVVENTVIKSDPEILGGTPVFQGTRVPVRTLIEYLEAGDRLDDFLDDFPTVDRKKALQALEVAKEALLELQE